MPRSAARGMEEGGTTSSTEHDRTRLENKSPPMCSTLLSLKEICEEILSMTDLVQAEPIFENQPSKS
jgi:hypothetical protein